MKRFIIASTLTLYGFCVFGATDTPDIITEDQLPPGGEKVAYLSDFLAASISSYGIGWFSDDKMAVNIYWTDSEDAYIQNLSTYSDAWVKARVDGNTLTVPNGQTVLVSDKGTVYSLVTATVDMQSNSMEVHEGISFTVNADRSCLRMEASPDNNHVLGFYTMDLAKGSIIQAFSKIKLELFNLETVSPPETAKYKRFAYSALLGGFQKWENGSWMAFDGSDVYVQGLEWIHPQGWVKGALMNDGSIRIPSGQYLGMNGNYPDFYFAAEYEGNFAEDNAVTKDRSAFFLNFNKDDGSYMMSENECFFCGKDIPTAFPVIDGTFVPFDVKAAVPAPAESLQWDSDNGLFTFHIPMTDTDGNLIDRYLLSFSIYVNGEKYTFDESNSPFYSGRADMIPASESLMFFDIDTDYMFGWNPGDIYAVSVVSDNPIESLGVELYYDVLGDQRESERAEMKMAGTKLISVDKPWPVAFYSIDGRLLRRPQGICIIKYSDGTFEKKILVK